MSEQTKVDIVERLHIYTHAERANLQRSLNEGIAEITRLRAERPGWDEAIESAAKVGQAMEELIALAETTFPSSDLLDARIALDEWRALHPSVADPATPSPTGTELALDEAKRHITTLTRFWMDNSGWHEAAEAARAFVEGIPADPDAPKQEQT